MSFTTTTTAPVTAQQNGVKVATRQNLNFINANVTDNSANNSVDIVTSDGFTLVLLTIAYVLKATEQYITANGYDIELGGSLEINGQAEILSL